MLVGLELFHAQFLVGIEVTRELSDSSVLNQPQFVTNQVDHSFVVTN
jgi:hypothetical protein